MTRSLAGRHVTVLCLLVASLGTTFAARADETAELIARLREAAKNQPFAHGYKYDLWRFGFREAGGVMAEIGLAQLGLGDLAGAVETSAAVPVDNKCMDCGDVYGMFLHDLSVALADAQRYDAAFDVLRRHHEDHKILPDERLAVARAQARIGDSNAAKRSCQEAIRRFEAGPDTCCGTKNEFGAVWGLTNAAFTQISNADPSAARTTRERIATLLRKLPAKGHERAGANARLAVLDGRLGDRAAADRDLQDAAEALVQKEPTNLDQMNYSWCWHLFAEARCRLGEFADAHRALSHIGDGSGDAGAAYANIALYEWSQRRFNEARATILGGPSSEIRGLVLVEIAKAQAGIDRNYKEALASVAHIKNDTIRARAMLEVAAVMAHHGLHNEARTLAERLDYPLLAELGEGPKVQFKFDDLKTWSAYYGFEFAHSMSSMHIQQEENGELQAAAAHCRVALQGRGAIPFLPEMNKEWDIQKAAEAQASEGDAAGALAWADKLATPERRLVALIATAEGHAEYLARKRRKPGSNLRLGRRNSLKNFGVGIVQLFGEN
jgi:hypothetical protein